MKINQEFSRAISTEESFNQKLSRFVAQLEEQKGRNAYIHRFSHPNAIADAFIIITATSGRHAQGLAESLLAVCREEGYEFLRMEGFDAAQWILVDCNDVIIHIFQEELRKLYRLEDLCRNAPEKEN